MRAKEKLRAVWSKREDAVLFSYPLGSQTKSDGMFLAGLLTDVIARELEERGYDKTTLKFSIEPKKGNQRFASQRGDDDGSNN